MMEHLKRHEPGLQTPVYVVDEAALIYNLEILQGVVCIISENTVYSSRIEFSALQPQLKELDLRSARIAS